MTPQHRNTIAAIEACIEAGPDRGEFNRQIARLDRMIAAAWSTGDRSTVQWLELHRRRILRARYVT